MIVYAFPAIVAVRVAFTSVFPVISADLLVTVFTTGLDGAVLSVTVMVVGKLVAFSLSL